MVIEYLLVYNHMLCYLGEYITIYQFQRKQQKLRLEEKERQLQSISRDREELKSKLSQLQSLVKGWVHSKDSNSVVEHHQVESEEPSDNNDHHGTCRFLSFLMVHFSNFLNSFLEVVNNDATPTEIGTEATEQAPQEINGNTDETAGKILNLISEIGANDMLTSDSSIDKFQPFFWIDSPGKLINV